MASGTASSIYRVESPTGLTFGMARAEIRERHPRIAFSENEFDEDSWVGEVTSSLRVVGTYDPDEAHAFVGGNASPCGE